MKPIEIQITGHSSNTSQYICDQFLDLERWAEFEGYSILPGIAQAQFETRTPDILGSRIKVRNRDGSSHVEEIIEWDTSRRISMRFQDFTPPLKYLATHFIETWDFAVLADGIILTRKMAMYPTGIIGWLMLVPISRLMKKAFDKNAEHMVK